MAMHVTPTVSRLQYRDSVKLVNAVAWAGEQLGLDLGLLDPDSIVRAAKRQTGLSDLGDLSFMIPMRRIAEEVRNQPEMTALARIIMRQSLVLAVRNRLQRIEWLKAHPDVDKLPIRRPIFVLGFPRTGTTVLQNLLSLDPRRRGLEFWELTMPGAHRRQTAASDRASSAAARPRGSCRAAYQMAPEMAQRALHRRRHRGGMLAPVRAVALPCSTGICRPGLHRLGPTTCFNRPRHGQVPYREYRAQPCRCCWSEIPAEQLVLKCPEHLFFIDCTPRKRSPMPASCRPIAIPYQTIGSYCSLISLQWRNLYGRHRPRTGSGAHMEQRLLDGVNSSDGRPRCGLIRGKVLRRAVHMTSCEDPQAVVSSATSPDHFELDLAPDHDGGRSASYLATKREDARGANTNTTPADYGLDRDRVLRPLSRTTSSGSAFEHVR